MLTISYPQVRDENIWQDIAQHRQAMGEAVAAAKRERVEAERRQVMVAGGYVMDWDADRFSMVAE